MLYGLLADLTVVLHLMFVVFVVFGGLLVLRHPAAARLHVPAAVWGAVVEFAGWICPLTPLENWFREQAGRPPYASGFVEHYAVPLLYPAALSPELQWLLGAVVIAVNTVVYAYVWSRRRMTRR